MEKTPLLKMRLDKWLWTARFFKTRSLAKQAIEKGQIKIGGVRPKPSRDIMCNEVLVIEQGFDEKTVTVLALSEQRGPAAVAQTLYEESAASIAARQAKAEQRKLQALSQPHSDHRPNKQERRQREEFLKIWEEDV